MTDNNHPITPPPELVQQWVNDFAPKGMMAIATQAARWGADQELEACCEWLRTYGHTYEVGLRADRRPKPPSLKEQALALLNDASDRLDAAHENTIRRALESLPD
jgi:hypothetical protein